MEMIKNSAVRVSDILTKIWENSDVKIEEGWKQVLKSQSKENQITLLFLPISHSPYWKPIQEYKQSQ